MNSMHLILTAFGAGLLASLTPCIYPMMPITLGFLGRTSTGNRASSSQPRLQVILFFLGQVLTFTALGLIAVKLGEVFGFSSQSRWVNFAVAGLLGVFAFLTISEKFEHFAAILNTKFAPKTDRRSGILTAILFGASSALVASPCSSPVLGGVLSQIAGEGDLFWGAVQMLAFASGMSAIFLVVGLGFVNMKKLPRAGKWMAVFSKGTSVLLVVGAIYYFYLGITG